MKKKFKELDRLHLEYEAMLIREIESMIGLAIVHGWKSEQYLEGFKIREKLRKAGSAIPDEQS
jgi:hypothetical protein